MRCVRWSRSIEAPGACAAPRSRQRAPHKGAIIDRIVADDGQVSWKSATFRHVSGTALLRSRSNLDVHAVVTRIAGLSCRASGAVGWGVATRPWVATRFGVDRAGHLHGTGEIFYTPGRLEGEIDQLTIAAPVVTRLVGGRGPLQVRGGFQGAPDRLRAVAHAAQGRRTLQLRALVDGTAHSATIDARLGGVPRPIGLHAQARYQRGTLTVPSVRARLGASRLDGRGRLDHQQLHAALDLRLAPAEARLVALRPAAALRAHVELDGPLDDLGVRLGLRASGGRNPGQLALRAGIDLPARRGHATIVARDLRPAQLFGRGPDLVCSAALTLAGRWARGALTGEAELARGRVVLGHRSVDELAGAASVRLGPKGEADIRRLTGRLVGERYRPRLALHGQLVWTPSRVALVGADAALGDSRWRGVARWRGDAPGGPRAQIRADSVTLAPALVARLIHYRPPASWSGRGTLDGTPADFALHLDAATELGPAALAAHVRRRGAVVELTAIDVRLGDSHLGAAARLAPGRVTLSLEELALQPSLLHRIEPALDPLWPIRLHGSADGPLDAVDVNLRLDAGPSIAELDGRIQVPTRRFRLAGLLDTFDSSVLRKTRTPVHATMQLSAAGAFAGGGVVGTLNIRGARGYVMRSPFYRGVANARLDGRTFEVTRLHVEVPGAKIAAKGGGRYSDFDLRYGVAITNVLALRHVPQALRVLLGINGLLPGRTIEGSIQRHPGKKIAFAYHVLPIGISQLTFLYRVVTGRVPFD